MTHDVEKAELANRIAVAIGVKRPADYDTRSTRRGVETGLIERFENIKRNLSRFVDVTHASVEDIIATQIAYQISVGETPIVDIPSVKVELANLERKYKIKQDTPTSGRRGSAGQKSKQLALIAEKIKPLNTVLNNYHRGHSLFYFESAKKPSSVFTDQIEDTTDSGFDIIPSIPEAFAAATVTVPKIPNLSVYDITENSVMLSWSPNSSPVTKYHLVIKNQDTGQTKYELDQGREGEMAVQGLDLATNYKAYIIATNEMGNSPEKSISFKTIGKKLTEIVPEIPIETPIETPIIHISPDTSIKSNMVSQSIGAFTLSKGRLKGDIIYIAEKSFNPYYYNKPLTSIVQIKDQAGFVIKLKPNNLNFTAIQRDERISIDEHVGDVPAVHVEFYVWKSLDEPLVFSEKKIDLVAAEVGLQPCQIGFHRDFNGKCVPDNEAPKDRLMDTLKGFLFGTVALSLLARKY